MAEDFIKEIYDLAKIIPETKKMISYCNKHCVDLVLTKWDEYAELFSDFCHKYLVVEKDKAVILWNEMQEIYSANKGLPFMGSRLESSILPKLFDAMSNWGGIDVTEGKYRIFSSSSGYLSLQDTQSGEYLYSLIDPVSECYEFANTIYSPKHKTFNLLGCGLGYLAKALYEISEGSLQINIYEKDKTIVEYGFLYGVLGEIPEDNLHITIDEDAMNLYSLFLQDCNAQFDDIAGHYVENWWTYDLPENEKEPILKFMSFEGTHRMYRNINELNFWRNIDNVPKYIDELHLPEENNNWIVVAAGPSLDEHLEYLREKKGKEIIICVSTCYKKLLDNNIIPDFVCVADYQNRTYGHFRDLKYMDVPMIVAANANWQFAQYYSGEKYLIPHTGAAPSFEYYKTNNIIPWNIGGTVTSMAIEVASRFGASKVSLIGVDLAYPSGKSHASGMMDTSDVNFEKMIQIKSNDGGMVYTSKEFLLYIADIENLVKRNDGIEYINMSLHGAWIKGTRTK